MTSFPTLLRVEMSRALARRAVRVLIGTALLGIAIASLVAFANTTEADVAASRDGHIARVADWWNGTGDSVLTVTLLLLAIGALIGGATVAGAEWRAGTVATTITWEPRRGRLLGARIASAAFLAAVISVLLQATLFVAVLPTILTKGSFDGVDGEWGASMASAVGRSALLCALAAVIGACVANLGRNTSATLAVAFVELAVIEGIVRAVWPRHARWLLGENIATFVTWKEMEDVTFHRGPLTSAVTLGLYGATLVVAAVALFRRRDLGVAT
jgi:hypothetical protein